MSAAYQGALVFYRSVKMAAAQDIPGGKRKTGNSSSGETETETASEPFTNKPSFTEF